MHHLHNLEFFSFKVLYLTFFVSKFHWSELNSLSTTLNRSKRGISRRSSISAQILLFKSGKFFFDLFFFEDGLNQSGLKRKMILLSIIWEQSGNYSSSHLQMRTHRRKTSLIEKEEFELKMIFSWNASYTSIWCCGQTIQLRPMKFWYKKRQT